MSQTNLTLSPEQLATIKSWRTQTSFEDASVLSAEDDAEINELVGDILGLLTTEQVKALNPLHNIDTVDWVVWGKDNRNSWPEADRDLIVEYKYPEDGKLRYLTDIHIREAALDGQGFFTVVMDDFVTRWAYMPSSN